MPVSVLYVDDELPHLMLAQEYLGATGKTTLTCVSSGKEAIDALRVGKFDVIVSDYLMQDMDGIQLLKYVRANYEGTPFILFTGKGKEDIVISALNNGADYYIRKGSDPVVQFSELEQRILQAHEGHHAKQELAAREQLYHSVLTVQTEIFVDVLPDLTIIRANDSYGALYATPATDLIGKKFFHDISDEDRVELEDTVRSLSPENPSTDLETVVTYPDGKKTEILWHVEGIFSSEGMVVSAKITGKDAGQAEIAREVLLESEQRYQQTTTDVPQHIGDFDENIPLNFIIENTKPLGNWLLPELVREMKSQKLYGIAATAGAEGFRAFLIFLKGEPEGGIYIDRSGVLYGDRSILFLKNSQNFTFYPTEPEIANRFVTGCRIYDKSHLRVPASNPIPEISSVRKGIGNIIIDISQNGKPAAGLRVTIKSGGKIVGNDVTSPQGQITFQLLYGKYTGVIVNDAGILRSFTFMVDKPDLIHKVDLS
ncbi:MAG TPA: response regulator [Methanospirillum sp.]|jgi:CheY-like chemotaxis protein|uniref:response regulator n=1 Tax=Methanospirillum sp. TaxID=45200 RepID=UPI001BD6158B|nr:response regulator [Methanospirillum sp.]HPY59470.1 response regulator [Methanospirillum sp.]